MKMIWFSKKELFLVVKIHITGIISGQVLIMEKVGLVQIIQQLKQVNKLYLGAKMALLQKVLNGQWVLNLIIQKKIVVFVEKAKTNIYISFLFLTKVFITYFKSFFFLCMTSLLDIYVFFSSIYNYVFSLVFVSLFWIIHLS